MSMTRSKVIFLVLVFNIKKRYIFENQQLIVTDISSTFVKRSSEPGQQPCQGNSTGSHILKKKESVIGKIRSEFIPEN